MDHLLGLEGNRGSEFLLREVFLRSLPEKISIVVAASTSGLRDLAVEADKHFAASGMLIAEAQLINNNVREPTPEVQTSFRPRRTARSRQSGQLACVSITPDLVQKPAVVVRRVRGYRLPSSHAFRETPGPTTACEHGCWPAFKTLLRSRLPVWRELLDRHRRRDQPTSTVRLRPEVPQQRPTVTCG